MNEGGGTAFKMDIQHRGDIDHKVAVGVWSLVVKDCTWLKYSRSGTKWKFSIA